MTQHLVVTVRLHEPRFHGTPEWPPAPGRLFQALAAGAAEGSRIPEKAKEALSWLERLPAPFVCAPKARLGSRVDLFVPNNDLDAEGGDPSNIGNIRTKKLVVPRLLEGAAEFSYVWELANDTARANDIAELADNLYQFGRGIDPAWAEGKVLDGEVAEWLESQQGEVFHPSAAGASDLELPCPTEGTLESLVARYDANRQRLRHEGSGKTARVLFTQPPKARFAQVAYEARAVRVLYELRQGSHESKLFPWSLNQAGELVQRVRDAAAERLTSALPSKAALIERFLIGKKPDEPSSARPADRIRIIPLGSIGSEYVDRAIRRIVVDVPPNCALNAADVHWAFSGLGPVDPETGEVPFLLTEASEVSMLDHYVPAGGSRKWRTVTAVALSASSGRRRIDPGNRKGTAKDATERLAEEKSAMSAVHTALRHANIRARALSVRVQREPFEARGAHAESFAQGTRFSKHQLWHVEVTLDETIQGPLVIGDGRFLGLGVMAPVQSARGALAFRIHDGLSDSAGSDDICQALRRAVMARVQAQLGPRAALPSYFSGHEPDGSPSRGHEHVACCFDPSTNTLFVIPPHLVAGRAEWSKERDHFETLKLALDSFSELRAGKSGLLRLASEVVDPQVHPLFAPARVWHSVTPYVVTRHAKSGDAAAAIALDVKTECERRHLPQPEQVVVTEIRGVPGVGLAAQVRLEFAVAISGPLLLGKTRHLGGGVFAGKSPLKENR